MSPFSTNKSAHQEVLVLIINLVKEIRNEIKMRFRRNPP